MSRNAWTLQRLRIGKSPDRSSPTDDVIIQKWRGGSVWPHETMAKVEPTSTAVPGSGTSFMIVFMYVIHDCLDGNKSSAAELLWLYLYCFLHIDRTL